MSKPWNEMTDREIASEIMSGLERHIPQDVHAGLWAEIVGAQSLAFKRGEAKCEKLRAVLKTAENRGLDWDMMGREDSMRLLQNWRGDCFKVLKETE